VLYELLAGCGPFDDVGASVSALRAAHEKRLPKPISERLRIELPCRLEQVLQQALAKNPHDRFASAREMHEALVNASSSLVYDEPTFVEPDPSRLARDGQPVDDLPGSFGYETQWASNY
jgi:serine/threonine protein kinase